MPSYSNQIVNYELLITNYRCESQKSLQRYRKITNSLLGITIFKDFKFRERELFWSLRSLGFPENYSRWQENLFQKIFIFKRKDAKTQSFILNTESTKDTKNYQKLEKWSLRSLDGTKIIHDGQKIYSRKFLFLNAETQRRRVLF